MPFKPSSVLFALTLSLGAMLAQAAPKAKAATPPAKSVDSAAPAATAPATGAPAAAPATAGEASASTVVYLGKSGSRYHLKGCRYLKGAGKEITVGEAMKKGYAPCNVCKAPRLKR
ncbi:MAG: hypothetical protein JF616_08625 [Fibrobacteres bacterium]|nr:hypothetical protein [Fibrobacterota bacterium]